MLQWGGKLQNEVIQMTTYGGRELAEAFRTVRNNTIQVAEDIPESKYDFVAAEGCKTGRRMVTHGGILTWVLGEGHGEKLTKVEGIDLNALSQRRDAWPVKT